MTKQQLEKMRADLLEMYKDAEQHGHKMLMNKLQASANEVVKLMYWRSK